MSRSEDHSTTRPTIFVDADACPVTAEAIAAARKHSLRAVIAGNSTQNLARHIRRADPREETGGFWVDTLPVAVGSPISQSSKSFRRATSWSRRISALPPWSSAEKRKQSASAEGSFRLQPSIWIWKFATKKRKCADREAGQKDRRHSPKTIARCSQPTSTG